MLVVDRRLCVLFHESRALGAGLSILRVLDELASYGWTTTGWFPGSGPLSAETRGALAGQAVYEKPLAASVAEWRRAPGIVARAKATPRYLRALGRWLIAERPHVVHANSLLMLPEAALAHALGFPVVVHVHELPPAGKKRDVALRAAARVADVLIGVSEPVAAMLRARSGRTPVVVVRSGVPPLDRVVAKEGPRDPAFVVGTIGYVSRTKGTDVFLNAAEVVLRSRPGIRFEHVGDARLWGDELFDRTIEELAASSALRNAVTFLGRRSVPECFAGWDLFVLSSRREGFPLSTLEAMAVGLPVIATDVGGVREQIAHLETGVLVPAEDANALAEWIIRLHDDAGLRTRLAQEAGDHVRESFTLSRQAEGLHRAYEAARYERRARSPTRLPGRRKSATR